MHGTFPEVELARAVQLEPKSREFRTAVTLLRHHHEAVSADGSLLKWMGPTKFVPKRAPEAVRAAVTDFADDLLDYLKSRGIARETRSKRQSPRPAS